MGEDGGEDGRGWGQGWDDGSVNMVRRGEKRGCVVRVGCEDGRGWGARMG